MIEQIKPMKVYIAASYPRKAEAQELGVILESREFIITSGWHQGDKRLIESDYFSGIRAARDMAGVETCDMLIELIGDSNKSRGGRHCELGMAIAWNKKIILIGGKDYCIFTNLPWLSRFTTVDEFLKKLV